MVWKPNSNRLSFCCSFTGHWLSLGRRCDQHLPERNALFSCTFMKCFLLTLGVHPWYQQLIAPRYSHSRPYIPKGQLGNSQEDPKTLRKCFLLSILKNTCFCTETDRPKNKPWTKRGKDVFCRWTQVVWRRKEGFLLQTLDISFCLFATQILRAHILQLTFDTQFWFLSLIVEPIWRRGL